MKLEDSELVQWNDGTQWQRGRVQRTMGCVVTDSGLSIAALESESVLVRHSCDAGLEFVPQNQLRVQPEEHPE
jgi:hypothetical protein